MNHQKARQLENSLKWHYTNKGDGRITPLGYCAGHKGHGTAEQANECYKGYLINNNLLLDGKWTPPANCLMCQELTDGMASIPWAWWYAALCDTHRTQEVVEKIFVVGESWES